MNRSGFQDSLQPADERKTDNLLVKRLDRNSTDNLKTIELLQNQQLGILVNSPSKEKSCLGQLLSNLFLR